MSPRPRPGILEIAPYVPGESKAGPQNRPQNRIVKLSSNEGALGVPPGARAAYEAALVREVTGLGEKLAELLDRHVVLAASAWLMDFEQPVGPGDERAEDGIILHGADRPREWVLPLDAVVSYGDNACAELALRPPRQGEMQKALGVAGAAPTIRTMLLSQITLLSLVTGQPRGVIERIPHHVVAGAATWLQGFTLPSPATMTSARPA